MLTDLQCHPSHVNVYLDQNIMQRKSPMELNFEGIGIQK